MDLANLTKDKAHDFTIEVEDPRTRDGTPLLDDATGKPVTITLIPRDGEDFQKVQRAVTNRAIKAALHHRRPKVDADEVQERALDLLVAQTKAWSGIKYDGAYLDCTPENVRMIYTTCTWLREQVEAESVVRANFLGNSQKTS